MKNIFKFLISLFKKDETYSNIERIAKSKLGQVFDTYISPIYEEDILPIIIVIFIDEPNEIVKKSISIEVRKYKFIIVMDETSFSLSRDKTYSFQKEDIEENFSKLCDDIINHFCA